MRNDQPIAHPELEIGLQGREEIVFFAQKGYVAPHADLPGIPASQVDLSAACSGGALAAGNHRIPVSLAVPPFLVPSFPNEKSYRSVGFIPGSADEGLYVEYWLTAALRTGLVSHSRVDVPVTLKSPNFQLGWIPQSDIVGKAGNANVRLYFPSREVRAGETFSFRWAVSPIKDGDLVRVTEVGLGLRVDSVGGIFGHLRQFRRAVVSEAPVREGDSTPPSGTANLSIPEWFAEVSGQQGRVYLSSWEVYINIEDPHQGVRSVLGPSLEPFYLALDPPTAVLSSAAPQSSDSLPLTSEGTNKS